MTTRACRDAQLNGSDSNPGIWMTGHGTCSIDIWTNHRISLTDRPFQFPLGTNRLALRRKHASCNRGAGVLHRRRDGARFDADVIAPLDLDQMSHVVFRHRSKVGWRHMGIFAE